MRELQELRKELDEVDRGIVALFEARMAIAQEVAEYKLAHDMPVLDRAREEAVLASREAMLLNPAWGESIRALYTQIMALSRAAQEECIREAQKR